MSVTKVQRSKDVKGAVIYALYETRKNMRAGRIRAAEWTLHNGGSGDPMEAVDEWLAELSRHPSRVTQAQIIIQSFHPDELDCDNPAHVLLAHGAGNDLVTRLEHQGVFFLTATHTDSASGHVHNHIIIPNFTADGFTPRNARNWHRVKNENDSLMRSLGLSVVPTPQVKLSEAERMALKQGRSIDSTGVALEDLTGDTWKHALTTRVDSVLAAPAVVAADSAEDGLAAAQSVASRYNVSIRRRGDNGVSFALVDDAGEVLTYSTPKRARRKMKRPGASLGSDYTLPGLLERIEELQRLHQAQIAAEHQAQAVLDDLLNFDMEEEDEQLSTEESVQQALASLGGKSAEGEADKDGQEELGGVGHQAEEAGECEAGDRTGGGGARFVAAREAYPDAGKIRLGRGFSRDGEQRREQRTLQQQQQQRVKLNNDTEWEFGG